VTTVAVQALTRDGFDLRRHPLSMLALGEHGWIQVINFISAGVLSLIFAVGVARRLQDGPGSTWAPRLLALFGAGLVIGGIFRADPALGFPAGAPAGYPEQLSVHGTIHAFAPPLAFLSVIRDRPPVRCRGDASGGCADPGRRGGVLRAEHPCGAWCQRATLRCGCPRLRLDRRVRRVPEATLSEPLWLDRDNDVAPDRGVDSVLEVAVRTKVQRFQACSG
jgi:hypothetical protein